MCLRVTLRDCVQACPSEGANKPPGSAHCARVLLPGSLGNLFRSFLLLSVSSVPVEKLKLFGEKGCDYLTSWENQCYAVLFCALMALVRYVMWVQPNVTSDFLGCCLAELL